MTGQRVVILGEARVDEVRDPGGVRESVSGDAVELAAELLGHGLALTVVAPVAEDADGERIRTTLEDRGIRLVPVPAPEGTPRRSIVRDRTGVQTERSRGERAFPDTRRSLAAQADADLIVDLRDREATTIAETRDEVLRDLGLGAAVVPAGAQAPAASADPAGPGHVAGPGRVEDPDRADAAEAGMHADASEKPRESAASEGSGSALSGTASSSDSATSAAPGGSTSAARAPRLLPAPIIAGTYRHAPVRLMPEAPVAHAPGRDWHGLEERLTRIAT